MPKHPPQWTPEHDAILLEAHGGAFSYVVAARKIAKATRGRFSPHATTCLRRAHALREEQVAPFRDRVRVEPLVSTQVDAIPARVRPAPPAPPGLVVLSLNLARCDARSVDDELSSLLLALPPGWRWRRGGATDEERRDAIASARHQTGLRGASLVVLENDRGEWPVVAVTDGERTAEPVVLVVVYFDRP